MIFSKFTPFPRAIRKPPRSLAHGSQHKNEIIFVSAIRILRSFPYASTFTTGRGGILSKFNIILEDP
ncbi:hypothetical protein ACJROX_01540 [Pseudalkalibacillus sp. A8]|uniref:hypothetical protein n=1 Tax=Pseudalkalibacillus sp. A8 TaxID=3382641 RepID=UPI0038B517D5